jgi:hypothetical protein
MRSHVKLLLIGLFMTFGLTWASEAWAFLPSGGSRLLYPISKRSFAEGAGDNTAQTLIFIINANNSAASRVGVKYYRGDCEQTIGPIFRNIGAGQTLTIDAAAEAPAFQDGVAEVFFVNNSDQPIRNDFGSGSSIIIDQIMLTVVRLPAALLHSDDRAASFNDPQTTIADTSATVSFAPAFLIGQFNSPSLVRSRLAVFAPGTNPGTRAADTVLDVNFRQPNGTGAISGSFDVQCGRQVSLAEVRGQSEAAFEAAFPDGGAVAPAINGQEKGLVGWLVETIQLPDFGGLNILFGQQLQSFGVLDPAAHP